MVNHKKEAVVKFDAIPFSIVNRRRCEEGFKHSLDEWSIAEWTNALAGEAGEAANIGKKLIRFRNPVVMLNKGADKEKLEKKLLLELADTVIYADLTAQKLNANLWYYVVKAFNDKSKEMDLPPELFYGS